MQVIRNFFVSLKSVKKVVGSGSISQRYGSGDQDPDPHQNVTDLNTVMYVYRTEVTVPDPVDP